MPVKKADIELLLQRAKEEYVASEKAIAAACQKQREVVELKSWEHYMTLLTQSKETTHSEYRIETLKTVAELLTKRREDYTEDDNHKLGMAVMELLTPIVLKDFDNQAEHLTGEQLKQYKESQADFNAALLANTACEAIIYALNNIGNSYRRYDKEKLINYIIVSKLSSSEGKDEDLEQFCFMNLSSYVDDFIERVLGNAGDTPKKDDGTINMKSINFSRVRFPMSKVAQKLLVIQNDMDNPDRQIDLLEYGGIPVNVGTKSKPCDIYVSIIPAEDDKVSGLEKLTEIDRSILFAVGTICHSDRQILDSRQVHEVLTGGGKINPALLKEIDESLEKMRKTDITISCANQEGLYANLEAEYKSSMFPAASLKRKVKYPNGKVIEQATVWQLYAEPPLFSYSRALGQMQSFPIECLAIENLSNTKTNIALKTILMEQVGVAKNNRDNFARIKYITLFSRLPDGEKKYANKTQKQRIKKDIKTILSHFKELQVIKDFADYGRAEGIEIITYPTPPTKRKK